MFWEVISGFIMNKIQVPEKTTGTCFGFPDGKLIILLKGSLRLQGGGLTGEELSL